ncbi:MAG TPA: RICIN domain-containing protein [Polyangiaceae bacterium]|nr:RICIN domain-containing protein [Polyangiaceae bacterium]
MKKLVASAMLGLSVVASASTATKPAAAAAPIISWENLKALQAGHKICMGVSGGPHNGRINDGTHIIVWDCTLVTDQVFTVASATQGEQIQDQVPDPALHTMCLNDTGGTNDRGAQVTIAPCNGSSAQEFNQISVGSGCFLLQNVASGRVIGVANASANPVSDGMSVIMWDFNGSADQMWCPVAATSIPIS